MPVMRGQCDAKPTVTFPAASHHRPLAGTKLYCLVIEARVNNLPRVALDSGAPGIQTCDLLIASPAPYRYAAKPHSHVSEFQFSPSPLPTSLTAVDFRPV